MKRLKLILIGLTITFLLNGQTKIKGGITLSSLSWDISRNSKYISKTLLGYSASIGMDYFDRTYYNLSFSMGVLRKGGVVRVSSYMYDGTESIQLDYVSFNTTIDFKYPIKKLAPFVSIGPRVDYIISHDDSFKNINKFSTGVLLGAGIKYNFSKIQIGFQADYFMNFNRIVNQPSSSDNYGTKVNDRTFALSLILGIL